MDSKYEMNGNNIQRWQYRNECDLAYRS